MIDVALWQQRVGNALDLQRKQHPEWKEIIKLYKGELFGNILRGNNPELSEMNFLYEYSKIKVGSIYSRNPHIFCRSRSTMFAPFAETMETSINYLWREFGLKQKIKKCVHHSSLIPPAWIGIGYTGILQTSELSEGELGIMDETIKQDNLFAEFISPWEMCWPDGYHEIRNCPYLIRIQTVPVIDLWKNPLYKESKHRIKPTQTNRTSKTPTKFTMKANLPVSGDVSLDDETSKVTLFHIWDKRSNQRFTIAEGFWDDTLRERKWDYLIEGFPHYPLIFNEIPQTNEEAHSYPMSDVKPMLPQLRDLSLFNTAMMRHGKRAGTVIIARKGGMTPEEIKNIQSAGDIDLVLLESVSADTLQTFTTPSLPSDWYRLREVIIEDLMRISGYQQLLGQQRGIETATESENLAVGQMIRQSDSVDTMEDFTVDIARGLAGLLWQFFGKERIAEIIGEEVTPDMWPELPEDMDEARRIVQAELQFRIDAGSTRPPKDEAVERKQWIDAAAALKASFPNAINDAEMAKQVAKKTGFKDLEKLIRGNEEGEAQAAQEENKLLMQGIRQIVSPNENHQIHLTVHGQIYQVPGMQATPEVDEHIQDHTVFYQQQQPRLNPQRGDTKPGGLTTMPELKRRGVPDYVDLRGGATAMRGVGANV